MSGKQTRINLIRERYPICDLFHGTDGYEDGYFQPEEDIDQDDYDHEL